MGIGRNILDIRSVRVASGALGSGATVESSAGSSCIIVDARGGGNVSCLIYCSEIVPTCCRGKCRARGVSAPRGRAGSLNLQVVDTTCIGCSVLNRLVGVRSACKGCTRGVCDRTNGRYGIQIYRIGAGALISIRSVEIPPAVIGRSRRYRLTSGSPSVRGRAGRTVVYSIRRIAVTCGKCNCLICVGTTADSRAACLKRNRRCGRVYREVVGEGVGLLREDTCPVLTNISECVITIGECSLIKVSGAVTGKGFAGVRRTVSGQLKRSMRINVGRIDVKAEVCPVIRCIIVLSCGCIIRKVLCGNLDLEITEITTLGTVTDIIGSVQRVSTGSIGLCFRFDGCNTECSANRGEKKNYEQDCRDHVLLCELLIGLGS